jgi:hypothetical protein
VCQGNRATCSSCTVSFEHFLNGKDIKKTLVYKHKKSESKLYTCMEEKVIGKKTGTLIFFFFELRDYGDCGYFNFLLYISLSIYLK